VKSIQLVCIGKLKNSAEIELEAEYKKRIQNPNLEIHELKALDDQKDLEARELLKKISALEQINGQSQVIVLTERGKLYDSVKLSSWLEDLLVQARPLIFVIAGAAGPGLELIKRADQELSLSPLTFPHKIARYLLIEQLYRAQTLRVGHPYHK
jgi:23S rRNA (pseudouridine1915-N3)-methyltransferase